MISHLCSSITNERSNETFVGTAITVTSKLTFPLRARIPQIRHAIKLKKVKLIKIVVNLTFSSFLPFLAICWASAILMGRCKHKSGRPSGCMKVEGRPGAIS